VKGEMGVVLARKGGRLRVSKAIEGEAEEEKGLGKE
jgi:hypothetical protein